MNVLLVTYDLNKEIDRPDILKEVKKTAWAQLSESSYAIATEEQPDEVYSRFEYLLDENDSFYVITLKQPHAGWGPEKVNEWLSEHLTW